MKNLIIILMTAFVICNIRTNAQDMFEAKRLTFDPAQEGFASWSPDGKYLIFQHTDLKDTIGKNSLWKVSLEGTESVQVFSGAAEHARWSPDGKKLAFTSTRSGNFDVWIIDMNIEQIKKELQALNK